LAGLARFYSLARKGVRAKDAKDAKVRKAIIGLFLDHTRKIEAFVKGRSSWPTKSEVPVSGDLLLRRLILGGDWVVPYKNCGVVLRAFHRSQSRDQSVQMSKRASGVNVQSLLGLKARIPLGLKAQTPLRFTGEGGREARGLGGCR